MFPMRKFSIWAFLLMLGISAFAYLNPFDWLALSHVEANVPSDPEFERILNRDLVEFFKSYVNKENIVVESKLLRKAPTQSGIAFPKFYSWVVVKSLEGEILTVGAARLAAIEQSQFEVTDFLTAEGIRKNPDVVGSVFPRALVGKIINAANLK